MNDWKKVLISPHTKIREVVKIIDMYSLQIALVVDENNKLLGTVTDGDIRRGIIKGVSLENSVDKIMCTSPVTVTENTNKEEILTIFKIKKLRHLPVVSHSGCVKGIERLDDLLQPSRKENWVVIMAGGLGNRLRPLTENCPKPMLQIGGKPILETILNHLIKQGFTLFYFSINYKAQQIQAYFGDGSKWGVQIHYINEEKVMGTAGSLSLFQEETDKPIIVMNGDILTKLNFEQLVGFHMEHQAQATVAVAAYDFQVPYGVVKVNKDRLAGFEEKPVYTSFINAGIYVLNPVVLKKIPQHSYYDMNHLLEMMLSKNEQIFIFPIREYWVDIGEIDGYNQANNDFDEVFK